MPDFAYTARDVTGAKVTGTLSAASEKEAVSLLSGKSLFPLEVKVQKIFTLFNSKRVSGQVMATAYGQLSSLLRSGVPLLRSLTVLREQSSKAVFKEVLADVHDRVEDGATLAEGMAKYPGVFSEMAVSMVRAGGEGGFLEDALERVAVFTEEQEDLKSRTIGALAYPVFLAVIGSTVVIGLVVFFVPKFAKMFDRLRDKGELPILTDWLLWFSGFLRSYSLLLLALFIAVVVAILWQLSTEAGKYARDAIKIKMPLLGRIFQSFAVARFCRVLGTLLLNGVPILKALEISRQATGNRLLSDAVAAASENISSGQSLAKPLAVSGHFPRTVVEMISVAEESNSLDRVLVEISDSLEKRTARELDLVVRLLEPMMLLVLAGVILFVVIALLLPVIKMSSAL
ncbi:MAG: type II secretory pathway component PulF [Pirellulaceae bacterium]|jgi:type II secretory pathway component PulF